MATRQIIEIDGEKCNGCGACETGCPEGALRIIDGKARLVGENLCDGLGACLGNCPLGAIAVVEREAEAYDEAKVMEGIAAQGANVIAAHLDHLRRHGQEGYVLEALAWLAERGIAAPAEQDAGKTGSPRTGFFGQFRPATEGSPTSGTSVPASSAQAGCPGSRSRRFSPASATAALMSAPAQSSQASRSSAATSALSHWPIQLHLVNPRARQFGDADLLVAADCTAFALGAFHRELLEGRSLVIACPKLDSGREQYVEKLAVLLGSASTVTVAIMEVPCCSGLLKLVLEARERLAAHKTVELVILGIEGGFVARKSY
jgi:NAD-dependent dihydropyrimidine dehydrogenase PreA subunit